MEHYGILSILPPLIAIVLAIVTKQVLISLFLGIFAGTMILTGYNPLNAFLTLVNMLFENLGDASWNAPWSSSSCSWGVWWASLPAPGLPGPSATGLPSG